MLSTLVLALKSTSLLIDKYLRLTENSESVDMNVRLPIQSVTGGTVNIPIQLELALNVNSLISRALKLIHMKSDKDKTVFYYNLSDLVQLVDKNDIKDNRIFVRVGDIANEIMWHMVVAYGISHDNKSYNRYIPMFKGNANEYKLLLDILNNLLYHSNIKNIDSIFKECADRHEVTMDLIGVFSKELSLDDSFGKPCTLDSLYNAGYGFDSFADYLVNNIVDFIHSKGHIAYNIVRGTLDRKISFINKDGIELCVLSYPTDSNNEYTIWYRSFDAGLNDYSKVSAKVNQIGKLLYDIDINAFALKFTIE